MSVDGYEIFDPKVDRPLHEVSRKEARAAFDWFMSQRATRIEALEGLVAAADIPGLTKESLDELHDWFVRTVRHEATGSGGNVTPLVYLICNDIGILLGELLIDSSEGLTWTFFTSGKKNIAYQRPVITGFDVPNKKYNIDFDYLLCQYAHRLAGGGASEEHLFGRMLGTARSRAKRRL